MCNGTLGLNASECTCAVQGFGNVGSISAKLIEQLGVKIIAISDISGGYYNKEGINIKEAIEYVNNSEDRSLKGYAKASKISNEELLELDCDILVPAAMEDQITKENAANIKAKIDSRRSKWSNYS